MTRPGAARLTVAALLALGIGLTVYYRDRLDVAAVVEWTHQAGPAAPLLFIAVYALATVLFLPGAALTVTGGALFGPVLGTVYNLTGATLGATLAFAVSRYLASGWALRKLGGRAQRLITGVEREGCRAIALKFDSIKISNL